MAKTLSFGVMHLITAFSVTYALTGSVTIAGAVTFIEPLANTVLHYFFDKYWDHPRLRAWRAGLREAWLQYRRYGPDGVKRWTRKSTSTRTRSGRWRWAG